MMPEAQHFFPSSQTSNTMTDFLRPSVATSMPTLAVKCGFIAVDRILENAVRVGADAVAEGLGVDFQLAADHVAAEANGSRPAD